MEKKICFPFTAQINEGNFSRGYSVLETFTEDDLKTILCDEIEQVQFYNKSFNTKEERKLATKLEASCGFLSDLVTGNINFSYRSSEESGKKYNIFSLLVKKQEVSLKEERIRVSKYFEKQILDITENPDMEYEEKINELSTLFNNYGFLVPTKIYFGGRINIEFEEEDQKKISKINAGIKAKMDKPLNGIKVSGKVSFGEGDSSSTDVSQLEVWSDGGSFSFSCIEDTENWLKSLDKSNYSPILFAQLRPLTKFLSEECNEKASKYLHDYIKIRENRLKYKMWQKKGPKGSSSKKGNCSKGKSEFKDGVTDENDLRILKNQYVIDKTNPHKSKIFQYFPFFLIRAEVEAEVEHDLGKGKRIVGWRITSKMEETKENGAWEMMENGDPLGGDQNKFHFIFISQKYKDLNFLLEIFYLEEKEGEYN